MFRRNHLFRDLVILTIPAVILVFFVIGSAVVSFYNAEIRNFAGYPTRSLRVGSFRPMFQNSIEPITNPKAKNYLSEEIRKDPAIRSFDLRVHGNVLERLNENLPLSAKEWQDAHLFEDGKLHKVDARHRGQRMQNFFFAEKSWKLKTGKRGLIDGYRTINLTEVSGRLDNHLTFLVAAEAGLSSPRSRVVRLFLNMRDQGVYLQEEQIDESMMRRVDRMPGDVFYGELFVPDEPKRSTDDLFCNPFLWRKKAANNKYPEEHRPYLTKLLDLISDDSVESYDELYQLIDRDQFALYFALISFQGDQHVDHSHNHKLFFNPLTGKFEVLPWNIRLNMPRGHGVESMANRMFVKLARDPRFLDRTHELMRERFLAPQLREKQLEEIARIKDEFSSYALRPDEFERYLDQMRVIVQARAKTLRELGQVAEVRYETSESKQTRTLQVFGKSLASLSLDELVLSDSGEKLELYEDRDFDGQVSVGDRRLPVRVDGKRLIVDAPLAVGRDFSAPYRSEGETSKESFLVHRQFTRLAYLESSYLLTGSGKIPEVQGLKVSKTLTRGPVNVQAGAPDDWVATETIHPWRFRDPEAPRAIHFSGVQELREDLLLREQDTFHCDPGTELRLAAGVSILVRSPVNLQGLRIRRLDPDRPWGVFAIQGDPASGSELTDCDFEGGSTDNLDFVDYYGMLSVHEADNVVVKGGEFSRNLFGDDTVRFAHCDNLLFQGVTVQDANGDAIDCDISTGLIQDARIVQPHNDGIDLMTANVNIRGGKVLGAGDKGISMGENANPQVRGIEIVGCQIGIAMKDGSDPRVQDSILQECVVGIGGYDKNWRYPGGGRGKLVNCTFRDNETDVKLDEASRLVLENCELPGRFDLPPGPVEDYVVTQSPEPTP